MTWLLKVLGGGVGPYLAGMVAVSLLGMGGTILWQRAEVAELKTDVVSCAGERRELAGKIELQNAEVSRISAECLAKSKAADLAAVRVISKPPAPAPGTGPEEMNRWFARRLASR